MAPWLCRTTFQRTVAKLFYHAGFEDFQPAALEVATDVASDFFLNLVKTLKTYSELEKTTADNRPKYTLEEQLLLSLHTNGLDIDGMDAYLKDDMDRLSTKLGVVHERLKAHFAEIFVSLHLLLDLLKSTFTLTFFPLLLSQSDLHLATTLVQTASGPSTTAPNNSSAVTLQKILTRISSASASSASSKNSASKQCPCPCTSSRTVFKPPTTQTTHPPHPPPPSPSPSHHPTNPSQQRT